MHVQEKSRRQVVVLRIEQLIGQFLFLRWYRVKSKWDDVDGFGDVNADSTRNIANTSILCTVEKRLVAWWSWCRSSSCLRSAVYLLPTVRLEPTDESEVMRRKTPPPAPAHRVRFRHSVQDEEKMVFAFRLWLRKRTSTRSTTTSTVLMQCVERN